MLMDEIKDLNKQLMLRHTKVQPFSVVKVISKDHQMKLGVVLGPGKVTNERGKAISSFIVVLIQPKEKSKPMARFLEEEDYE